MNVLLNCLDADVHPARDLRVGEFLNAMHEENLASLRWHGLNGGHYARESLCSHKAAFWIRCRVHGALPCLGRREGPPDGLSSKPIDIETTDYVPEQIVKLGNVLPARTLNHEHKRVLIEVFLVLSIGVMDDVTQPLSARISERLHRQRG